MDLSDEEIDAITADRLIRPPPDWWKREFARAILAAQAKKQPEQPNSFHQVAPSGEAATQPALHDNNHPYVRRGVGCGHGVLFTDPCVECEIVSLQEQYRSAARTIALVRDRLRVLGRPMLGETSGGRKQ